MLESAKLQSRQSEIRQSLADYLNKPELSDDEQRSMDALDKEYRSNETKYRAAIITEESEKRDAENELETRAADEWQNLVDNFEVRQAALHLDEGIEFSGQTAEVVQELRSQGGYRGVPVPYQALETRAGETVAGGVPDPVSTQPIIDRLFPQSVAGAMGAQMVNVGTGHREYPLTTSSVSAAWSSSETGNVASATQYQTTDRELKPDHNLGVQMKLTRRALKSTSGIEQAVRRDMRNAIEKEMDKAAFQGSGSSGEPLGVISGASTYGITEEAIDAAATWSAFRGAVTDFLKNNSANSPGSVRVLFRPEIWDALEGTIFDSGSGVTEWDRMLKNIPASNIATTSNALSAPSGSPLASKALLATNAGGQAPIFVATWGAIDMIRDPYSDAQSGGIRLTGLVTMDVSVSRTEQLQVLTGLQ